MLILLILFFISTLIGIKFFRNEDYDPEYMGISQTRMVSGIFVLMVFMSHLSGYFNLESGEKIYFYFRAAFSQLIVAPFFFYSGYGVYQSIKNKGSDYVRSIPYKRIFRVWYHFAIAVCFYWLMVKLYGYRVNPVKLPLVFLGWVSIGNSNWFIFDILVFYLISHLSFTIFKSSNQNAVWCNLILCILYGFILSRLKADERVFYNLILVYPFGMLYGYYRKPLEEKVQNSLDRYGITLAVSIAVFITLVFFRRNLVVYEIHGILFVWILALLTMKIRFGNGFLKFLGDHIFEIYIYQRIPMTVLSQYGIRDHHLLYGLCCFAITVVIATTIKQVESFLDERIFRM